MKGIRLTDAEVLAICKAFRACFLSEDHLWLFGSRTNLNKRGGDIDLYIETKKDPNEANASKMCFLTQLELALGEQKIDVVIKSGNFELPIYNVAKAEGIQLL
jgi:hypothetical protein